MPKLSLFVAMLAWISTFLAGWMIFLRAVPSDAKSSLFFSFFFLVAIIASSMSLEKRKV